jgi:hypothetical protein
MMDNSEGLTVKTAITRGANAAWRDFCEPWGDLAALVVSLFRRVGH